MAYYRHTKTHAKGRWFGKTLQQVSQELGPGAKCVGDPASIVKLHDIIEYTNHMHEPPAPDPACDILADTEKYVVVNKFSGIPTHPTVNYYKNTLTERLRPYYGALHPCYRLDRLTSGVLILAKSPTATAEFAANEDRSKFYYARVKGYLRGSQTYEWPILHYNSKRGYTEFRKSYGQMKPAKTIVEELEYSSQLDETIVRCIPLTGRTHQIRRHLSLAGHPIVNDELYIDGAYNALYFDPSEKNFNFALNQLTSRLELKKTGQHCDECGVPLYHNLIEQLWLHCAFYRIGAQEFRAPDPEWMKL